MEILKKVHVYSPVFPAGTFQMEICVPFTCFISYSVVSGLLAFSAVPVKRCVTIWKFWVNAKQSMIFLPNGNSKQKFPEILGKC